MDAADLRTLLAEVAAGTVSADDAVARLRALPFADLGFARVDHHRALRQGRPEAVYAPGKSPEHVTAIVGELLDRDGDPDRGDGPVIVSRADPAQLAAVSAVHPGATVYGDPHRRGGATVVWRAVPPRSDVGEVVVVTAGTADLPVAEECAVILTAHGVPVHRVNDAGVAGIQRILGEVPLLQSAVAVVVVAGMEGALASVVGGLTGAPVIAVPTSVGYGSGLDGVTALLAMTASCASGVTVVGIDNGFGAACAVLRTVYAHDVARMPERAEEPPGIRPAKNLSERVG